MPKKKETTRKRRVNGEGTFYQRPDKSWVHQITLGYKPDGTPERKAFAAPTKEGCLEKKRQFLQSRTRMETEAQEAAVRADAALQQGHSLEAEALFSEAFLPWLQLYKAPPTTKPTTFGSYIDVYNTHLLPYFGEMQLHAITTDVMQAYYQEKQKDGARKDGKPGGLSAKTIRNHHMLLKDFFDYAKKKYRLDGNPTEDTNRPEVITPQRRVLSTEEMSIFIQEVMKESQRVAILFNLFTGLRRGELLALRISDLNLTKQTFRVSRNLERVQTGAISMDNPNIQVLDFKPEHKTQLIIQNTPKTKSSCREVPMSDALCGLVVQHIFFLQHTGHPNPDNLLFPSKTGTHIDPKSFEIRLTAVSKRCEIRKVNPHALRHTFATRLVEENVPLTTVKEILGHSSIQTTQLYTHGNVERERDAITGMTNHMDMSWKSMDDAAQLNGTKKRMKFADVKLPDFSKSKPKKNAKAKVNAG